MQGKNVRNGFALLVLLGAVLWLAGCQAPPLGQWYATAREWLEARLGPTGRAEPGRLVASGTIRADEIRIASELGGRIVALQVEPGDPVTIRDEARDVVAQGTVHVLVGPVKTSGQAQET